MHFTKIGIAHRKKAETGNEFLQLELDSHALKAITEKDFELNICVLRRQNHLGKYYYEVMTNMPDDYTIDYTSMARRWAESFQKRKKQNTNFQEWLDR